MTSKGIKTIPCAFTVREVIDKLQTLIRSNGATVYARIDQQLEIGKVGLNIPPLEFIMFGNPRAGGKLMMENPVIALDLPLKIAAWEDKEKKVWLSYNDSQYIGERYGLSTATSLPLDLDKLIDQALNH